MQNTFLKFMSIVSLSIFEALFDSCLDFGFFALHFLSEPINCFPMALKYVADRDFKAMSSSTVDLRATYFNTYWGMR